MRGGGEEREKENMAGFFNKIKVIFKMLHADRNVSQKLKQF